tara:strand:- start:97 stop:492 length:396 start_codon:yes stop_codon:yes gene_type:complete
VDKKMIEWWNARLEEAIRADNRPLVDAILKDINRFYLEDGGSQMTEDETRRIIRSLFLLFLEDHEGRIDEFAFYGWLRAKEKRIGKFLPVLTQGQYHDGRPPFQAIKQWMDGWTRLKLVKSSEETIGGGDT